MKWTIVHGLLHLAGYDHERGPRKAARMAALESRLLRRIG
jgi:ssRNA-specific RNase YbeY (16S rRNA maturation enzyme)